MLYRIDGGAPDGRGQWEGTGVASASWGGSDWTTDPDFVPLGDRPSWSGHGRRESLVYAAVKLLIDAVIPIPRAVYRGAVRQEDHPLNVLLDRPSAAYDRWTGWEYSLRAMLIRGNGYWIIRRRADGIPVDLIPAVEGGAYYPDGGGQRRYTLSPLSGGYPGEAQDLPMRDVVALHWHGFDGLVSPSPVGAAVRRQLRLIEATITLLDRQVRRANNSGGVIQHRPSEAKEQPSVAQLRRTAEVLRDTYAESSSAQKTPVLPPGLEGGAIPGLSQADSVALDILRWGLEDVARIYSISPARLGQMSGGGAGVRTQQLADQRADFAHFAAAPVSYRLDAALTASLLTVKEQMDGLSVRGDTTRLFAGSPADVASLGVALVGGGLMTPNEVRRLHLGLPDHPDGDKLSAPRGAPTPAGKNPEGGDPRGA